ncbi:MAG TPA: phosphomannose isomerase type II C-terminal cupin domain [Acidimicrobiales bacterium]|nr:phosphomannose isomerase type II C-terminal cupin domain [Acidimicrobiales bacterium]
MDIKRLVLSVPPMRLGQTVRMERERDERPWGCYEVLEDSPTHKVKRIEVSPGQRLSYQRHERRGEHWFVVAGRGHVTLDGTDVQLEAGEAVDIPKRAAHRIANTGSELLVFIEVQHGDYFGEDDIERLEDDFGRAP